MKYSLVALVLGATTLATAVSHGLEKAPVRRLGKRCTGTITSLKDVAAAVKCQTVNIKSFTVDAGKTFQLDLVDGAVVNLQGDITFGSKSWEGPLMLVSGQDVTFNGGGHKLDGQGALLWDGKGSNDGVTKPKFFKVKMSGVMDNFTLLNRPVQGFSVSNPAKLVMSNIIVDVRAGAAKGHNTDAFDISRAKDLTITHATVYNQDDCVAINDGDGITIENTTCTGGHGISIGSITANKTVKNVVIQNNKIINTDNGLRIKTYDKQAGASVSSVRYTGNVVTNAKKYGIVIQQDYTNEGATGKVTKGVPIKGVYFTGINTVTVASNAKRVYILCAKGSCSDFDFAGLKTSGGSAGSITNVSVKNYSL